MSLGRIGGLGMGVVFAVLAFVSLLPTGHSAPAAPGRPAAIDGPALRLPLSIADDTTDAKKPSEAKEKGKKVIQFPTPQQLKGDGVPPRFVAVAVLPKGTDPEKVELRVTSKDVAQEIKGKTLKPEKYIAETPEGVKVFALFNEFKFGEGNAEVRTLRCKMEAFIDGKPVKPPVFFKVRNPNGNRLGGTAPSRESREVKPTTKDVPTFDYPEDGYLISGSERQSFWPCGESETTIQGRTGYPVLGGKVGTPYWDSTYKVWWAEFTNLHTDPGPGTYELEVKNDAGIGKIWVVVDDQ